MNQSGSNFRKTEKPSIKDREVSASIKGAKGLSVKSKNRKREIYNSIDEDEDDYFKNKYKRESAMDYMDDDE